MVLKNRRRPYTVGKSSHTTEFPPTREHKGRPPLWAELLHNCCCGCGCRQWRALPTGLLRALKKTQLEVQLSGGALLPCHVALGLTPCILPPLQGRKRALKEHQYLSAASPQPLSSLGQHFSFFPYGAGTHSPVGYKGKMHPISGLGSWAIYSTVYVFLISLQSLDDSCICFQAAFSELIQIIHHVKVWLEETKNKTSVLLAAIVRDTPINSPAPIRDGLRRPSTVGSKLTLSTWAWEACCRVFNTTSRYFLNSPPMARAISPNTDRICGFTDLWTFSF